MDRVRGYMRRGAERRQLSAYVDDITLARIDRWAADHGVSRSTAVRMLTITGLQVEEQVRPLPITAGVRPA